MSAAWPAGSQKSSSPGATARPRSSRRPTPRPSGCSKRRAPRDSTCRATSRSSASTMSRCRDTRGSRRCASPCSRAAGSGPGCCSTPWTTGISPSRPCTGLRSNSSSGRRPPRHGRREEGTHMAQILLEDVWKVFPDGTEAVGSVDLHIVDGEFMVLVGPSGCGKTTALRMVAGLEEISEGVLRIGERIVNHVPSKDRDIAMVFQSYALYPHLSVYDNIAFGLKLKKVPKDEIDKRVQEAAMILGLDSLLKRKPRALSGGQRQRVAMGRAIVRQPQAFLM